MCGFMRPVQDVFIIHIVMYSVIIYTNRIPQCFKLHNLKKTRVPFRYIESSYFQ